MSKKEDTPKPPQPPEVEKRLHLKRFQWIGIPLIMLLPILALFGVFGVSTDEVAAANGDLAVTGQYVSRFRYKMIGAMSLEVENLTASAMPTVTVAFDREYIESFSTVTFSPSLATVTEDSYQVELTDVAPGEARVVVVEMQAEEYFSHPGSIVVTAPDAEPLDFAVATWVFP